MKTLLCILLIAAIVVGVWWLFIVFLGWVAGAFGIIPAIIVAALLIPRGRRA